MSPDENVCFCFRVTKRKIVTFCKREQPKVASQLTECHGAGTGCGWCVPFLKILHEQCQRGEPNPDLPFSMEDYAKRRLWYQNKGERITPDKAP